MRVSGVICAVLFAAAGGGGAWAETAGSAPEAGTPTVTIINRQAEEEALPELEVTPPSPASAAATPADESATVGPAESAKVEGTAEPLAAAEAEPQLPTTDDTIEKAAEAQPDPTLAISIDLTNQSMTVSEHGIVRHTWKISSARYGYRTPTGTYRPTWMSRMWHSRQYDYAPMPYSIFFHKGVAIHGTYALSMLGRPASHGCVRLAPRNARALFNMVSAHGKARTEIVVHGAPVLKAPRIAEGSGSGAVEIRRGNRRRYLPPSYAQRAEPRQGYYYSQRTRRYYPTYRAPPRGLFNSY